LRTLTRSSPIAVNIGGSSAFDRVTSQSASHRNGQMRRTRNRRNRWEPVGTSWRAG
jgi:hypothetical protein